MKVPSWLLRNSAAWGGLFLAVEGLEGGAVDEVDVEPAVVVEVDQADAGAVGLDDEVLLRDAHLVDPSRQAGFLGDVLEDDRAAVDESAGGDGPLLLVVLSGGAESAGDSAHPALLRLGGRCGGACWAPKIEWKQKSRDQVNRAPETNARTPKRRLSPTVRSLPYRCLFPCPAGCAASNPTGGRGAHEQKNH